MKATRSCHALPELKATEHRLSAVIDGVEYAVAYVLPTATYAHPDPDFATKRVGPTFGQTLCEPLNTTYERT